MSGVMLQAQVVPSWSKQDQRSTWIPYGLYYIIFTHTHPQIWDAFNRKGLWRRRTALRSLEPLCLQTQRVGSAWDFMFTWINHQSMTNMYECPAPLPWFVTTPRCVLYPAFHQRIKVKLPSMEFSLRPHSSLASSSVPNPHPSLGYLEHLCNESVAHKPHPRICFQGT